MQPRLAKKIVQRVQAGDVNRTSYRQDQVVAAFRVMGETLTPEHLAPWAPTTPEDPAVLAARVEANRQRRDTNLKLMAARRAERQERITQAKAKVALLRSLQAATPEVVNEVEEVTPEAVTSEEVAVAAARQVFAETMAKGEVPTAVTIEPESIDYNTLTVAELRAEVKKTGLKGYSAMTKTELIAALTAP